MQITESRTTAYLSRGLKRALALLCAFLFLSVSLLTIAASVTRYSSAPGKQTTGGSGVTIDHSNSSLGYIAIKHDKTKRKTKLRITGKGNDTYDLTCDGSWYYFPLKDGSRTYTITTYGLVSGTKYAQEYTCEISATISDSLSCYLYPNQRVMWTENSAFIKEADKLCEGLTTDMEKVQALYKWVTKNITYDYIKALKLEPTYLPDNNATYKSRTGICYDLASLLCAMLRSQGVYSQLITGVVNGSTNHAWVKVYVNGEWKSLDPTYGNKYSSDSYKQSGVY